MVSVLFNESKLLKCSRRTLDAGRLRRFSTLQRVEIAEIMSGLSSSSQSGRFSTLQRVEIAEIVVIRRRLERPVRSFSTLQRVEIAEIQTLPPFRRP